MNTDRRRIRSSPWATATWDELVAAGRCECGRLLEGHPASKPLRPLRSWHAETSGPRCIAMGFNTEEGIAQAAATRAARENASRASNGAPGGATARSVVSGRTSGRVTPRTAPRFREAVR
jgi:hypothetical protein